MYSSTTINKPFTSTVAEARPVSHLAAITLLATSIYAVHSGAEAALHDAPGLVTATTAAMVGFEWLQWTALGRMTTLDDARHHTRANVLKLQCAGIAALQVLLYTIAVVSYAAKSGADWAHGWPLAGSVAIASLYAFLNFVAKWTSCDTVEASATTGTTVHNGGTPAHAAIFGERVEDKPAGNIRMLQDRAARESQRRAVSSLLDDAGRNTVRDENGRFKRTG